MMPPELASEAILLSSQEFLLHKLSCMEVIQSFALCDQLRDFLAAQGLDPVTANALAQHGVLAYLSLSLAENPREKAFASPEALLTHLTLEDLLAVYRQYQKTFRIQPE